MKKILTFFLVFTALCNLALAFPEGNIVNPKVSWNSSEGEISTDIITEDVNLDGSEEIIYGVNNVLNANKGNETLWRAYLGRDMHRETSPKVVEFHSSDGKEILIGAERNVYLLNSSGRTIWRSYMSNEITSSPVKIKSGGGKQVFLTTNYPVLLNSEGEVISENKELEARPFFKISSSNQKTIVTGIKEIYGIDLSDLSEKWSRTGSVNSEPAFLERDAGREFIFRDMDGNVIAIDSGENVVWRTDLDLDFYMGKYSSPGIADLNQDGVKEIIVTGFSNKRIYILDSRDGEKINSFKASEKLSKPVFADIDGDGNLEAISSYIDGDKLYAFEENGIDWRMETESVIKTTPHLFDFDEDGLVEIIYGTDTGLRVVDQGENVPPEAFFTFSKDKALVDENILFNASRSEDKDSLAGLEYKWDFDSDDGEDSGWTDMEIINHSYQVPGNYTVELKARDFQGAEGNFSRNVSVFASNRPPEARFLVERSSGTTDTEFEFVATPRDREDSSMNLSVKWDFEGDGIWETEYSRRKRISHQFDELGVYNVSMKVKDSEGATDITEKRIEVKEEGSTGTPGSDGQGQDEEGSGDEIDPGSGLEQDQGIPWIYIALIAGLIIVLFIFILIKTEKEKEEEETRNYRTRNQRY